MIVGGGVIGLSVAWEAARRGMSVRVFDQTRAGKQASWAGAGMLPPGNREHAADGEPALRALSDSLWAGWSAELRETTGIDNGFRRCGGISVKLSSGDGVMADEIRDWHNEGVAVESLAAAELRDIEPQLSNTFQEGYFLPTMGQVRNPRHLKGLIQACLQAGVEICEHEQVLDIETEASRIVAVHTPRRRCSAGRYVFASGAWTASLLRSIADTVDVFPVRGQMALLHASPSPLRHIVESGKRYLVPRGDGRILVGATEEAAGFEAVSTVSGIAGLLEFAVSVCPSLASVSIERTWAGLRPGRSREFPFIGPLPGYDNAWCAAGHFRAGLQLSPGTAVLLTDLLTGVTPVIDARPFQCADDRATVADAESSRP